jgi:hypothetical protein
VGRFLLLENLFKSEEKSKNCRSIKSLGGYPGIFNECIVSTENKGICIKEEKLFGSIIIHILIILYLSGF